jgi:hypothetical protein
MPNKENLTSWQPGQSGNPKGREKGTLNSKTIITKWLQAKEKIKNPITGKTEVMTQYDAIVLAQLAKARAKGTDAFNALLDRLEGKPKQQIELNQEANIIWKEERYDPNRQTTGGTSLPGGSGDNGALLWGSSGRPEVNNGMLLAAETENQIPGNEGIIREGSSEDTEGNNPENLL